MPKQISEVKERSDVQTSGKLSKQFATYQKLCNELRKRSIQDADVLSAINMEIEHINAFDGDQKRFKKQLRKSQSRILKLVQKKLTLVPKNYHQSLWTAIGMSAFGVPIGVTFGMALDNMALLGLGLPMGLALGIVVGSALDRKAKKEGRALDVDINW